MADEGERAASPAAQPAADDTLEFEDWTCRLMAVERLVADPDGEDGEDVFEVRFQVDGPNANAAVEVVVADATDEAHVVAIAQHTLHVALTMWGRATSGRLIKARAGDLPKRGALRRVRT